MAKSYIEYLEEILRSQEDIKNQQISVSDSEYEKLKDQVKNETNKSISAAEASYGTLVDTENVKKLINERKINEATANMGLTDSGLNRTQQTAVQLNHSNNVSSLFAQRRAQIDALKSAMDQKISKLEDERLSKNANIGQSFLESAQGMARDLYDRDITAEAKAREDELLAQQKILQQALKEQEAQYKEALKSAGSSDTKTNSTNKDDNTHVLTDKELSEGNLEAAVSAQRKGKIEKLLNGLLTRKDLSDERKLDKTVPPYEKYLKNNFNLWFQNGEIVRSEYEYLIKKYNLKTE